MLFLFVLVISGGMFALYDHFSRHMNLNAFSKKWVSDNDGKPTVDKLIALLELDSIFIIESVLTYYKYDKVGYYRKKYFSNDEDNDLFVFGYEYDAKTDRATSFITYCDDIKILTMDFDSVPNPTLFGHPKSEDYKFFLRNYRSDQVAELIDGMVISYYHYRGYTIVLETPINENKKGKILISKSSFFNNRNHGLIIDKVQVLN